MFKPYCSAGCIVSDTGERTQLNILRDTAALQSLLSSRSVPLDALRQLDDVRWIRGISGNMMEIPLVEVWLESDFCNETVQVCLVDTIPDGVDFLFGNDLYCKFHADACDTDLSECVISRSMMRKSSAPAQTSLSAGVDSVSDNVALPDIHRLFGDNNTEVGSVVNDAVSSQSNASLSDNVSSNDDIVTNRPMHFGDIDLSSIVSRDEFVTLQRNDVSLISLFDLTESEPFPDNRSYLFVKNGLLMRREIPKSNHYISFEQLVVPTH